MSVFRPLHHIVWTSVIGRRVQNHESPYCFRYVRVVLSTGSYFPTMVKGVDTDSVNFLDSWNFSVFYISTLHLLSIKVNFEFSVYVLCFFRVSLGVSIVVLLKKFNLDETFNYVTVLLSNNMFDIQCKNSLTDFTKYRHNGWYRTV